jgi:hypothetical protein
MLCVNWLRREWLGYSPRSANACAWFVACAAWAQVQHAQAPNSFAMHDFSAYGTTMPCFLSNAAFLLGFSRESHYGMLDRALSTAFQVGVEGHKTQFWQQKIFSAEKAFNPVGLQVSP